MVTVYCSNYVLCRVFGVFRINKCIQESLGINITILFMCYDTAQLAYRIYKEAKRLNASDVEVDALYKKWKLLDGPSMNYYHASGFNHPNLVAFIREKAKIILDVFNWGLVPHWIKNESDAKAISDRTLLARVEEIEDKPSYREAVKRRRCILPLDGFYEHYHKNNKTYPFYITAKDKRRLLIAGITSDWRHPQFNMIFKSVSIVTTRANDFMKTIHNNPKISEARMPLIVQENQVDQWINDDSVEFLDVLRVKSGLDLKAVTVNQLRGRNCLGNIKEVQMEKMYPELIDPLELF